MDEQEHELILPPISDQDNICLPLSVNAVSKYWNIELPLSEAIEKAKKYSNTSGSILIEGIELAERHGLSCLILSSDIDKLKKIIQIGIPPIVILPGLHEMVQHASIISGYDDNEKTIFHYVPNQTATEDGIQVGVIPEDRFDKLWSEDDRLMILLAPSEIISKLMDEDENIAKSNRLCFQSERSSLQQNKTDASKSLAEAIELNPKNSTAFLLLAGIQNEQNDHECINNYQKSLEINNRCYLAYRGLGNFYLKIKKDLTKKINANKMKISHIFHLAGSVGVSNINKNPYNSFLNNFLTLKNIVDFNRSLRKQAKLVLFSTSEVYSNLIKK